MPIFKMLDGEELTTLSHMCGYATLAHGRIYDDRSIWLFEDEGDGAESPTTVVQLDEAEKRLIIWDSYDPRALTIELRESDREFLADLEAKYWPAEQ